MARLAADQRAKDGELHLLGVASGSRSSIAVRLSCLIAARCSSTSALVLPYNWYSSQTVTFPMMQNDRRPSVGRRPPDVR